MHCANHVDKILSYSQPHYPLFNVMYCIVFVLYCRPPSFVHSPILDKDISENFNAAKNHFLNLQPYHYCLITYLSTAE